jgi:hydroxyacylglutathione hydrolase
MPVVPVACLADNYAYVVYSDAGSREKCAESKQAVVIDPSEAGPIVECLERLELRLSGLLLTHHHWDHVGGTAGLRERYGEVPVLAHRLDGVQVRGVSRYLEDGDCFNLGKLDFAAMHVPGHTLGALAYRHGDALFTGDTLFIAGCGRLFEGTAADMYGSLTKIAALPEHTQIYCGHEYALRNLAFARAIEPGNVQVIERIEAIRKLRDDKRPSVPQTLRSELETNPFLRCDCGEFRQRSGTDLSLSGVEVFAQIRSRRDVFQA